MNTTQKGTMERIQRPGDALQHGELSNSFCCLPSKVDILKKVHASIFFQVRSDSFIWEGNEATELQESRTEAI